MTNILHHVAVAALCFLAIGPTIQAQDEPPAQDLADLRALADAGEAGAQFNLGQMYFAGNDHAEASTWYRRAAEQDHVEAQYMLGWMYHFRFMGTASPSDLTYPDVVEAVAWYHKAAEQGHVEAQHKLGRMYHDGRGVPQDFAEAVAWYHKAAEQGQPQALWYLGDMYREGWGVPQDSVEAHRWYNLAASRLTGDQREDAATDRDAVAVWMTTEELNEAQRHAREWHAAHPVQMRSGVQDELATAGSVGGTAYRPGGGVYRSGTAGLTAPRLLREVKPPREPSRQTAYPLRRDG